MPVKMLVPQKNMYLVPLPHCILILILTLRIILSDEGDAVLIDRLRNWGDFMNHLRVCCMVSDKFRTRKTFLYIDISGSLMASFCYNWLK